MITELLEKIDSVEKAKEPKALKPKKTYYKFILKKPLSKSRASMKWNECVYYDIETAPWNENFKNSNDKTYLDIRTCNICAFTLFIPKEIYKEKMSLHADTTETRDIYGEKFYVLSKYDELRINTESALKRILDMCAKYKKKLFLVGFNNERFDNLIFEDRIQEYTNHYRWYFENGKASHMYVADLIYWSRSYGCNSLKELGKYVGIEKKEEWNTKEEYLEYNKRDVEILVHFLKDINDAEFTHVKPATEARNIMSREFYEKLKCEYIISSEKVEVLPFFGGRTEPYHAIVNNARYLDTNSLYPYVMINFLYPKVLFYEPRENVKIGRIETTYRNLSPYAKEMLMKRISLAGKRLLDKIRTREVITPKFCKELFENTVAWYGCLKVKLKSIRKEFLPYMDRILFYFPFPRKTESGITLFSFTDKKEYWIEFYELLFLCMFDYEILDAFRVYEVDKFPNHEKILERYNRRVELKKNKDKREKRDKIILNTSYGILATRRRKRTLVSEGNTYVALLNTWRENGSPKVLEKVLLNDRYVDVIAVSDMNRIRFYIQETDDERMYVENSIPIYGIAITSCARFTLYAYMMNAIFYKMDIHYCDTDSLICDENMYEFLQDEIDNYELGKLKLEYPNSYPMNGVFLAPKTYILVDKNGKVIKRMKGTGEVFVREIVAQSMKSEFHVYEKCALNPYRIQKRKYVGNEFLPTEEPEVSDELPVLYEMVKEKFEQEEIDIRELQELKV